MAQNILTVHPDAFRLQLHKISFSQLKQLMVGIYAFKKENQDTLTRGHKVSDEMVLDLLRKENLIQAEFFRRGYVNKKNAHEFRAWLLRLQGKKQKRGKSTIKTGWRKEAK